MIYKRKKEQQHHFVSKDMVKVASSAISTITMTLLQYGSATLMMIQICHHRIWYCRTNQCSWYTKLNRFGQWWSDQLHRVHLTATGGYEEEKVGYIWYCEDNVRGIITGKKHWLGWVYGLEWDIPWWHVVAMWWEKHYEMVDSLQFLPLCNCVLYDYVGLQVMVEISEE